MFLTFQTKKAIKNELFSIIYKLNISKLLVFHKAAREVRCLFKLMVFHAENKAD